MTFGRWLLVHSLSICILIMLGVGFFYKEELKLQQAYSQLLQIDPTSSITASSKAIVLSVDESMTGSGNHSKKPKRKVEANEVVVDSHSDTQGVLNTTKTSDVINAELNTKKVVTYKQEAVIVSNNESENTHAKTVDFLLEAREAFWDKNYQKAIELYSIEITKTPKSADLYGELGNIYYSLNNYGMASAHYLKAGELFIKNDDQTRAKQIYDILLSIDPVKAQTLLNLKNQQHQ